MKTPDFPWDAMHHKYFLLSQEAFQPSIDTYVHAIETKDFIPPGKVDWFKNPIPARDAFEEGNHLCKMSPATIKYISDMCIVTPYLFHSVKITKLAKNYGKLKDVNV
jgi:hypothetical protein